MCVTPKFNDYVLSIVQNLYCTLITQHCNRYCTEDFGTIYFIFDRFIMISELDLKSLWKELDDYEVELEKESKSLQEVWVKIAQIKATNEVDVAR